MEEDTLIIYSDEIGRAEQPTMRGFNEQVKGTLSRVSEVSIATLKTNMCRFLSCMDEILKTAPKDIGGLEVNEVEIHALIDSKGNIGIKGIVEAETATEGGIKIILRKRGSTGG